MLKHPLTQTLRNLKGNVRACVLTEPMWGIPYNLVIPYASVYMLALGLDDVQIGLIASIGSVFQIFFAFISGALTDKYGRRLTTAISDILSWGVASLIWAIAQDFTYFVIAVILNAIWRIPHNSWVCLLVEDADEDQLVHIWTWIYIAGLLAAFFAPLAGILINALDLIPAVRILYFFAFVLITLKGFILFKYSTETYQGKIRMDETRDQPLLSLFVGYGTVFKQMLRTPKTLIAIGIMAVMSIILLVNNTFWSIIVTERLEIPAEHIAIFPFVRSAFLLLLYFFLVPKLNVKNFRNPMLVGYLGYISSHVLLVTMPSGNYLLLLLSVVIEAFSAAMFRPLMDSLIILSIDKEERARINSIMAVIVMSLVSPFGWIAGQLSNLNRVNPFYMNIILFVVGSILVIVADKINKPEKYAVGKVFE